MKKQNLLKSLFTLLLLLSSIGAGAYDFEKDGICYNMLSETTVEVTGSDWGYYGDIYIPEQVCYNDIWYSVKGIGMRAFYDCSSLTAITLPESVTSIGEWAFYYCSSLASITFPENSQLESIGDYAFYYCSSLTSITIPINSQLESIGDYAFYYCSSLTTITLPESVTSIGGGAFSHCSSLTSIGIPSSVKSIGSEAFSYCTELATIELPSSVERIGEGVFACCSDLRNINVDPLNYHYKIVNNSLLTADGKLLLAVPANNWNLNATFVVPTGVTRIANYAFANNKYINRIELPEGVLSIGDFAFGGMKSGGYIEVSLPKSLTEIGNNIFLANYNATIKIDILATAPPVVYGFFGTSFYTPLFIYVPKGAKEAYNVAPWNEHTLVERVEINEVFDVEGISYRKTAEGICEVAGRTEKTSDIVQIPSSVEYNAQILHVTAIGNGAFEDDTDLTNIALSSSVTSIGDNAFAGCSSLKVFTMVGTTPPATGTGIYDGCSELSTIYVPFRASGAYNMSPWNAYAITEMPQGGTSFDVDGLSFYVGQNTLECAIAGGTINTPTLEIPSIVEYKDLSFKVVRIENGAFSYLNCTSVTIPSTVTHIGQFAFRYSAITSLTIPSSVIDFNPYAFCDCKELSSITVDPLNKVYDSREDCNAIIERETNILIKGCNNTIIPSSVTKLGQQSFRGSGITSISIPNSITEIDLGAFFQCKGLTNVIIPNSVTSIGTQAFGDCYNLSYATIPNGVSYMSLGAFSNCLNLKTVTLPTTIEDIGLLTFSNCTSLANVIMLGTSAPTEMPYGASVFYLCPEYLTIYSPLGTKDAFQAWSGLPAKDTHMLIEPSPYLSDADCEDCNIAYRRDFEDTNWQAWYVPFDMIYDKNCEDFVVARLGDIVHVDDDGDGSYDYWQLEIIRLNQGDVIEANRPYVIRANGIGQPTFVAKSTTLYASEEKTFECSSAIGRYTVQGVYHSEESSVKPYRWYLRDEFGASYTLDNISLLDQEAWRDEVGVESFMLSPSAITLVEGQSFVIETSISPFYAADKCITWSCSSNEWVVQSENGVDYREVHAGEPGTAIITATLSNGMSASCEVTVLGTRHVLTVTYDDEVLYLDSLVHGDSIMPILETILQPTKEGHTFSGWMTFSNGAYRDCPELMPEGDLTLVPEFTANGYRVTFKIGDRILESAIVTYGENIGDQMYIPDHPQKEGRIFRWNNWVETVPAHDVVIEGEYGYFITFMTNGVEYAKCCFFSSEEITPPDDPEMEWYEFVGWDKLPEIMPAEDIIVHAVLIPLYEAGDVNGDGRVSVVDVSLLTNRILGISNSGTFWDEAADMNGDGRFSVVDITMITNKILE